MTNRLRISLLLTALALSAAGCPGSLEDPDRFERDASSGGSTGATGGGGATGGTGTGGTAGASGSGGAGNTGGAAGSDAGAD